MSEDTYSAKPGDCVLAYVDGRDRVRAICWILREEGPGAFVALIYQAGETPRDVSCKVGTVRDPRQFEFHQVEGDPMRFREVIDHVSAAIRALAPLIP